MLFEISSIGGSRISRMKGANPRNGIEFLKTFAENGMKVKEIGLVILKSSTIFLFCSISLSKLEAKLRDSFAYSFGTSANNETKSR